MPIRITSLFSGCLLPILLAVAAFFLLFNDRSNDTRDGFQSASVPMVDPSGKSASNDFAYSQVNLNNSEANLNNANAAAVILGAQGDFLVDQGQADLYHAQACAVRNDCGLQAYQAGLNESQKDDWKLPALTFGGVILGMAYLFTRKPQASPQ